VDRLAHHLLPALLALFVIGLALASPASSQGLVRLDVTIGKSQVLELKEPFARASVSNPNVADVFVITPNQILVTGKAVGVTSLVVFYPQKTLFFDLVVQTDIALLQERLKQIAPRDEIEVQPAQDAIILSGKVLSDHIITAAAEVASIFAPKGKVVNLLRLTDVKSPQVMLQVHVGEVSRQALRELGFSVRALGTTFQGGSFPGRPFAVPLGTLGAVTPPGFLASVVGQGSPDFIFSGVDFFLSSGQRDYAGLVRALAERNLFRTLAKPNLVTESGKEAQFLSGGEFPIPVSQSLGTVTLEYKEFGVGLVFTPVVVDGDTINLKVRPEVSSIDFSQGFQLAGFRVPTLRKNSA